MCRLLWPLGAIIAMIARWNEGDKMSLIKSRLGPLLSISFGVIAAVAYGVFTRIVFGLGKSQPFDLFSTISIGFLFLVPLAIGALTVFFAAPEHKLSWLHALVAPWIPTSICLIFAGLLAWEFSFCLILAAPIFFGMSSLGGLLICLLFHLKKRSEKYQTQTLLVFLLAPYFFAPLENQFPMQDSIRTVHSQIEIKASPEVVWRNITRFRQVTDAERRFSWFHLAGLPRPIQATLSYEGIGGVRRGEWEDGLAFNGHITDWKPNERYNLRLVVDTSAVQPSPVPLKEIGGRYFDMVDDSYIIEPRGEGKVILHLLSSYRLTTRVNWFAQLWLDFMMQDLQNYILQIERERCE